MEFKYKISEDYQYNIQVEDIEHQEHDVLITVAAKSLDEVNRIMQNQMTSQVLKNTDINKLKDGDMSKVDLSKISFNQNEILGTLVYNTNKKALDELIPKKNKDNFIYSFGTFLLEELNGKK